MIKLSFHSIIICLCIVPVTIGNNFFVVSHRDVSHTFNVRQSYLTKLESVPLSSPTYGFSQACPPPPPYPVATQELQLLQELLRLSEAKKNQKTEHSPSVN